MPRLLRRAKCQVAQPRWRRHGQVQAGGCRSRRVACHAAMPPPAEVACRRASRECLFHTTATFSNKVKTTLFNNATTCSRGNAAINVAEGIVVAACLNMRYAIGGAVLNGRRNMPVHRRLARARHEMTPRLF